MNEWLRFLALVLATAIMINLAWMLIRPAMPFIAGLIVLIAVVHIVRWYRERW